MQTTTNPVHLALPSDPSFNVLVEENEALKKRVTELERRNLALQLRITQTIADWKKQQDRLRMNEASDIISDYMSEWYHNELLRFLQTDGDSSFVPACWADVAGKLKEELVTGASSVRRRCQAMAGMSDAEWLELYNFKRIRNMRVHPPRRNQAVIIKVLRELPVGPLKSALQKMFQTMKIGK